MKTVILILLGIACILLLFKSISKRFTKSLPSEEGFSIHKRKIELEDSEGTVNDSFKKSASLGHQKPGQSS